MAVNPFLDLIPETPPPAPQKPSAFWSGIDAFNAGAERLPMGIMQLLHALPKDAMQKVHQQSEADLAKAKEAYPILGNVAEIAGGVVSGVPLMAIPGAGTGLLARGVTSGAAQGGAYGLGQYTEDNDLGQRVKNGLLGTALGAALPAAFAGARKAVNPLMNWIKPKNKILGEIANSVDDPEAMFATKDAGTRVGLDLTPAEASGNALLGQKQGLLGRTEETAKVLDRFGKQHLEQQRGGIFGLLDDITPETQSAAGDVRTAAQEIIKRETKNLSEKAEPLYKAASKDEISPQEFQQLMKNKRINLAFRNVISDPDYSQALSSVPLKGKQVTALINERIDNLVKDASKKTYNAPRVQQLLFAKKNMTKDPSNPIVQSVLQEIKSDPVFSASLQGINPRSIEVLNMVKRNIDDTYDSTVANEKMKYKGSLLLGTKNKLLDVIDEVSPAYKEARSTFGEGAAPLKALKESNIGRIADLDDVQLKNVAKTIFDPAQTDLKVLVNLRDKIGQQNPQAWRQIVRNDMEAQLDRLNSDDVGGINFYNKLLKSDRKFNQYLTAVEKIPGAQKRLIDTRTAFKNLINPVNARSAAKLAQTSMSDSRNFGTKIKEVVSNLMGGRYDKAYVELITNPKWDKELKSFIKAGGSEKPYEKAIKYGNLLGRISTVMGVNKINAKLGESGADPVAIPSGQDNMQNPFLDLIPQQ